MLTHLFILGIFVLYTKFCTSEILHLKASAQVWTQTRTYHEFELSKLHSAEFVSAENLFPPPNQIKLLTLHRRLGVCMQLHALAVGVYVYYM
jgi:hypothetical protein